jgi:hypothetical protein
MRLIENPGTTSGKSATVTPLPVPEQGTKEIDVEAWFPKLLDTAIRMGVTHVRLFHKEGTQSIYAHAYDDAESTPPAFPALKIEQEAELLAVVHRLAGEEQVPTSLTRPIVVQKEHQQKYGEFRYKGIRLLVKTTVTPTGEKRGSPFRREITLLFNYSPQSA